MVARDLDFFDFKLLCQGPLRARPEKIEVPVLIKNVPRPEQPCFALCDVNNQLERTIITNFVDDFDQPKIVQAIFGSLKLEC